MKEYFTFKYKDMPTQITGKLFYQQLLKEIEMEYPDMYFSYSIGGITFNNLIYSLNDILKKLTVPSDRQTSIKNKIKYLLDNNYII